MNNKEQWENKHSIHGFFHCHKKGHYGSYCNGKIESEKDNAQAEEIKDPSESKSEEEGSL